ncbi:hypothetical protein PHET_04142 [Paragonimus heterotremus]|uniref:Uncharacterized protein n=1 Tax=Paragonimus heterotremus TaxID=100268 RepID=A0A8J4T9H6_9TREM|nr:hypothetical protein PHET_04142 [Paragonimus heterotremus]
MNPNLIRFHKWLTLPPKLVHRHLMLSTFVILVATKSTLVKNFESLVEFITNIVSNAEVVAEFSALMTI